jgi:HTH-type transcriptional regulator/antitoxin HigA
MPDIKRSQLNEIIKETKHKCRFSIIVRKALGIDADFWMEAQKTTDMTKARIEAKNKA